MPAAGWRKLSGEEVRLARGWYGQGLSARAIALRLDRSPSVLSRLLVLQKPRLPQGRPMSLTEAQVDFLVRRLNELVQKANLQYPVTAAMLKKNTRVKASERTIREALHRRKIYFRPFREKPVLTPEDVVARLAFAEKYRHKSEEWWVNNVHAFIDGKRFPVYLNSTARKRAAQLTARGAYRAPGQGLSKGYVKPKKGAKVNTGGPSASIVAAVCRGKVSMWHEVPRGHWNGGAAADMYTSHLAPSLATAWPDKRKWRVLEDNDPTGFKSRKGVQAKRDARIEPFEIPKRSPDLSLCDYALWQEVSERMRRQEARWPAAKKETREEYLARLKRTARRLPERFLLDSIKDMARRCQRLYDAKGYHFEEGGK